MLTQEQIKAGLSDRNTAEVARRIGCSHTYLNAVLNGHRNMGEKLQAKLSDYLKSKQWS